jgi:hypothetical protein
MIAESKVPAYPILATSTVAMHPAVFASFPRWTSLAAPSAMR